MSLSLISINQQLVKDFESLLDKKNPNFYLLVSSLASLDNNNEIQLEYLNKLNQKLNVGENLSQLFAVLQGLFVAIDSLYSLSYSVSNSKNFININQNQQLRELKYVRNDVVGHPTNRVYEDSKIGCCLLRKEDIQNGKFRYYVYFNNSVSSKDINCNDLIDAFYAESNKLLESLLKYDNKITSNVLLSMINDILKEYQKGLDIKESLDKLKIEYKKTYTNNSDRHRFIWRIDLIKRLNDIYYDDECDNDFLDYATEYQIEKLFDALNLETNFTPKTKLPKYISAIYRMFNNNDHIIDSIKYLIDPTHPLFLSSFNELFSYAKSKSITYAIKYLELIDKYYKKKDYEIVYCFTIVLKKYNKFK
ncbi:MAG: hypothetical protein ACRC5M_03995 [Anaeroplasmataceae bacterium]